MFCFCEKFGRKKRLYLVKGCWLKTKNGPTEKFVGYNFYG